MCVYFVFQSKKLFLIEGFPKGVLKNFSMGGRGWGGGYILKKIAWLNFCEEGGLQAKYKKKLWLAEPLGGRGGDKGGSAIVLTFRKYFFESTPYRWSLNIWRHNWSPNICILINLNYWAPNSYICQLLGANIGLLIVIYANYLEPK